MIKKHTAIPVILIFITVLFFSSCSTEKQSENSISAPSVKTTAAVETDSSSFKLSYSKSDSLNPFSADTLNNQVIHDLVFDSLFTLDESYNLQPEIASGYNYSDSLTLKVTIPSGIEFSNGEKLMATSVVYSFNQAKSSPHYKNSLSAFSGASAESDTVVRFKLNYKNPNAHNLLTFAIASSKSDKHGFPIGSGRYKFGESDGSVFLELNNKHNDFKPHITKITLVNITSSDSIDNAINIGNISYAFRDMSSAAKTKITANKKAVNLNNLVFLGINGNSGITANENIRKAVSLAIDRDTLVKSAYRGYAKPALSVFNPVSSLGKQTAVFQSGADVSAAKQAIAQSGYSDKELKLDILTNTNAEKTAAAQLIKQQLEEVGFKVTINREKNEAYHSKVKSRSFNLYIGETKLTGDMNLRSFFTNGGSTSAGINLSKSKTAKSYIGYLNSSNEIGKFILDFQEELPFVPLVYRQGMICYTKGMHGDMQGYEGNYFSNIEDWYFN